MRKVEILSICTAKYVIMSPLAFISALSDGKKIIYNSIFIKQNVFLFSTETGKIKNYLLIAGPNQKSVVNLLMHINRFIFKG